MKEITKAQEEILRIVWNIGDGAVSDVIEQLPNPKPAYTTVATVIKVLEKKGYLSHKTYGNTNVYFAIIDKKEYTQYLLQHKFKGLFNDSAKQFVSFFVKQKDLSIQELEELKQLIEKQIEKQK